MKRKVYALQVSKMLTSLFWVLTAGASIGFYVWMRVNPLVFLDQGNLQTYLYFNFFHLKLLWYLAGCMSGLTVFWLLYARTLNLATGIDFPICLYADAKTYLPCYLLLLNWLSFRYVLYKPGYLLPTIILIFILIRKYRFLRMILAPLTLFRLFPVSRSPHFRRGIIPVLIFILSTGFYLSLSTKLLSPLHVLVGDEPSYLMITDSLSKDGDVRLNNNYREKAYLRFFPGEYPRFGNIGKDGGIYPRHGIGLPLLLVPFYRLGDRFDHMVFFPRACMNLLTALLVTNFYLLAYEMTRNLPASLLTTFIFGFTTPVLFYSYQIYPEVPAGLILLYAFRKWRLFYRRPLLYPLCIGGAISLLPWFGVKYLILSLVLFLLAGFSLIRYRTHFSYLSVLLFLFPIILSGVLHAWFTYSMYKTISPTAMYGQASPIPGQKPGSYSVLGDLKFKLKRGLMGIPGVFLDQRIGLLFHSPLYFFSLAGILALWRKKAYRPQMFALLFIFLSYIFFYTSQPTAGWGGYSVMNRPVIAVIWCLGILMLFGLKSFRGPLATALRNGFFVFSFLLVGLYLKEPLLLYHQMAYRYQELRSNLLYTYSSAFLDLTSLFPAMMGTDKNPKVTLFWAGVTLTLLALCYYESKKRVWEYGSVGVWEYGGREVGRYGSIRNRTPIPPYPHTPILLLLPIVLGFLFLMGGWISVKEILPKTQNATGYEMFFTLPWTGKGLIGKYYDNEAWEGVPRVIRRDPSLDFSFIQHLDMFRVKVGNFPLPVNLSSFSVDWSGYLIVPSSGNYIFQVITSPRAFFYLSIDGDPMVVDGKTPRELTQGDHSIRIRLKELHPSNSQLILYWIRPDGQKEIIPAEAFRPYQGIN
ncbi:MAG TPA: PA14 domain-containing protein [Candidatus Limnocylindrales bacterium]|nr:PA14 domain-containing protein [Candidatus Limnocylindrales bacterium]